MNCVSWVCSSWHRGLSENSMPHLSGCRRVPATRRPPSIALAPAAQRTEPPAGKGGQTFFVPRLAAVALAAPPVFAAPPALAGAPLAVLAARAVVVLAVLAALPAVLRAVFTALAGAPLAVLAVRAAVVRAVPLALAAVVRAV